MNQVAPAARSAEAQPSSYVDRRALSEAWYDALYQPANGHSAIDAAHARQRGRDAGAARAQPRTAARPVHGASPPSTASTFGSRPIRVVRSALSAVAIERARCRARTKLDNSGPACGNERFSRTLCRATSPDGHTVDFLLQQHGDVLRLVALYDGRSARRVAAALQQSRNALAQRGIRIHIDTIEKGTS